MKRILILIILVAEAYLVCTSATIGNGTRNSPFNAIEPALTAAANGDTILITYGTYLPLESSFEISKSVTIIGGYNAEFSDTTSLPTILSGDVNGDDVYGQDGLLLSGYSDNTSHVVNINTTNTIFPIIENLTIRGGCAVAIGDGAGGGMIIQGANTNVGLRKVKFTGNYCSENGGGALYVRTANVTLEQCVFAGNRSAADGGALFVNGEGTLKIRHSYFYDNVSKAGSAVFFKNAIKGYFEGNTFSNNKSVTYGTFAVYNKNLAENRIVTLINNTFVNNELKGEIAGGSNRGGSALYVYIHANGQLNMANNTILTNSSDARNADSTMAANLGGAIFIRQGNVSMANNIVVGNYSTSGFGDVFITDGHVNTLGYNLFTATDNLNIRPDTTDILFEATTNAAFPLLSTNFDMNNEYALLANHGGLIPTVSVIDGQLSYSQKSINCLSLAQLTESVLNMDLNGDDIQDDLLRTDQRGYLRNVSGKASIGAYEWNGNTSALSSAYASKVIVLSDGFIVTSASSFNYAVYDALGRKVGQAQQQQPNVKVVLPFATGIYLVQVQSEKHSESFKIIL